MQSRALAVSSAPLDGCMTDDWVVVDGKESRRAARWSVRVPVAISPVGGAGALRVWIFRTDRVGFNLLRSTCVRSVVTGSFGGEDRNG